MIIRGVDISLGVPSALPAPPSGFPLYLFPLRLRLRFKRMPLQSLTHRGGLEPAMSFNIQHPTDLMTPIASYTLRVP